MLHYVNSPKSRCARAASMTEHQIRASKRRDEVALRLQINANNTTRRRRNRKQLTPSASAVASEAPSGISLSNTPSLGIWKWMKPLGLWKRLDEKFAAGRHQPSSVLRHVVRRPIPSYSARALRAESVRANSVDKKSVCSISHRVSMHRRVTG